MKKKEDMLETKEMKKNKKQIKKETISRYARFVLVCLCLSECQISVNKQLSEPIANIMHRIADGQMDGDVGGQNVF